MRYLHYFYLLYLRNDWIFFINTNKNIYPFGKPIIKVYIKKIESCYIEKKRNKTVICDIYLTVNPKDPSVEYAWFNVGMLDYNPENKLWLVQKINAKGRIVDSKNKPIVNGSRKKDGTSFIVTYQLYM